ncbi:MAG: nuclear transport factor 2 family protein [Gammaproteobacteria bacterium]
MDKTTLAESIFEAFTHGDTDAVRTLCSPDLKAIQNGGVPMDLETLIGFSLAVRSVVKNFRYEDAVRSETESGFVEEHSVRGELPTGCELDLKVCVVAVVSDGKITEMREYFDSTAAAGVAAALGAGK